VLGVYQNPVLCSSVLIFYTHWHKYHHRCNSHGHPCSYSYSYSRCPHRSDTGHPLSMKRLRIASLQEGLYAPWCGHLSIVYLNRCLGKTISSFFIDISILRATRAATTHPLLSTLSPLPLECSSSTELQWHKRNSRHIGWRDILP
jgi:hypothetical protein